MYTYNAVIRSTGSSTFWSGIETMRGAVSSPADFLWDKSKESSVILENTTIENAENACRNYDKDFTPVQTCGGSIAATNCIFKNNKRSILLYNENRAYNVSNPNFAGGLNWQALFQYCNFTFTSTFPATAPLSEIVHLTNCKNVTFFSCSFQNPGITNIGQSCAGIRGFNSSVRVQPYVYNSSAPRCNFEGLHTGIVISNKLETDRVQIVLNSDFSCQNDINFSGCFNPLIGNNNFFIDGYGSNPPVGIYLNNCTGYKVEGNVLKGHPFGGVGIVARNSGAAYNEIYRNSSPGYPLGLKIGIQSIGWNRNTTGSTGLKVLCNKLAQYHSAYDISVMADPSIFVLPVPPFGVANNQYVQGGISFANRAAGNVFYDQDGSSNNNDYFVQSATNSINQFQYRCNTGISAEIPSSRNFINVGFAQSNTCPTKNVAGVPPYFPLAPFLSKLANIESQVSNIEVKANRVSNDTLELDKLFTEQAELIDSAISYYQYANYPDSVAFVYEQVNKGYQYKLYLAATYVGLGRHDDAINLLNSLNAHYNLSDIELSEVTHLATIYVSLKWLYLNEDNWTSMPDELKLPVYEYEAEDPTSAGAVARSLLARFEDRTYDPMYILPPEDSEIMMRKNMIIAGTKVYPNPATDKLWLDWDGEDGIIMVTDITGRTLLQQHTEGRHNEIDINKLSSGLYLIIVKVEGKAFYQQKVVKK